MIKRISNILNKRIFIYASIIIVFLYFIFTVGPGPYYSTEFSDTQMRLHLIRAAILEYSSEFIKASTDNERRVFLERILGEKNLYDGWGNYIILRKMDNVFWVRSLGEDGIEGTKDDIIIRCSIK